jgi:hypothetical protein
VSKAKPLTMAQRIGNYKGQMGKGRALTHRQLRRTRHKARARRALSAQQTGQA